MNIRLAIQIAIRRAFRVPRHRRRLILQYESFLRNFRSVSFDRHDEFLHLDVHQENFSIQMVRDIAQSIKNKCHEEHPSTHQGIPRGPCRA